jgi:hypothetical protein
MSTSKRMTIRLGPGAARREGRSDSGATANKAIAEKSAPTIVRAVTRLRTVI